MTSKAIAAPALLQAEDMDGRRLLPEGHLHAEPVQQALWSTIAARIDQSLFRAVRQTSLARPGADALWSAPRYFSCQRKKSDAEAVKKLRP
ncbi:hypothetical protein BAE39_27370 [Mesorhizobium loti]|uniref:Uncharacterized protein n=1 Tax=Rhizobium loti TaxID=381 RepID=A0A1A5PVS0_RHILI|nr:hypothetical protein BAE39_27370 [Mesorhizobium loti]OBQ59097.1 hypothetical protein A8145_25995 [Mesorhizobium loti]